MFRDSFTFSIDKYSHDAVTQQRERRQREAQTRRQQRAARRAENVAKWFLLVLLVAGLGVGIAFFGRELIAYSAELSLRHVPDSSLTAAPATAGKRRRAELERDIDKAPRRRQADLDEIMN